MLNRPGTYSLVFVCGCAARILVGCLGALRFPPGYYVYVGSALGPGGIRARVAHHLRASPRPHWHIDYLKPHAALQSVWCRYGARREEHEWAARLRRAAGACAIPGFGASDCRCQSHLFRFARRPNPAVLGKVTHLCTYGIE